MKLFRSLSALMGVCLIVAGTTATRATGLPPQVQRASQTSKASAKNAEAAPPELGPTVKRYCISCHGDRLKTAGLSLEAARVDNVPADAVVWEKVLRKLKLGAMPPQGTPRPDDAAMKALIASLEGFLDSFAEAHPNPGPTLVHRLNRAEYRNAIRDVLDLDVDVDDSLPADDSDHGFDNISEALRLSPMLVSRYLTVAEKISALAVGDPDYGSETKIVVIPGEESEDRHVPGMPLGTIGGARIQQNFPLDADYEFRFRFWSADFGGPRGLSGMEQPYRFEITVDGQLAHSALIGGKEFHELHYRSNAEAMRIAEERMGARVPIKAGPHDVTIQFVPPSRIGITEEHFQPLIRSSPSSEETFGAPKLTHVLINGPMNPTGPGDTPSRRRILSCRPTNSRDETECAGKILSTLARRAYGRAATVTERGELMRFYERGRMDRHSFEAGIQAALPRIISGPEFLLRTYPAPAKLSEGAVYRIPEAELASRLALFLWSSIPDPQLAGLATQGMLRQPGVLEQQIRRMIADPKADAFFNNFGGQWLWLRNLAGVSPDLTEFPEFDGNLRESFLRETQLFFESIVKEDRPALDLLNADYTFVNERLARHYGIPGVYGPRFRRVVLTDENRRGLLGQGSILTLTGIGTTPVERGKWVLEQLMNNPPPPPPPSIPALSKSESETARSIRQMLEVHRKQQPCATCHRLMDPIGLALENFDAIGRWRTTDRGEPINAATTLFNGDKVNGPIELRQALARRPEVIVGTLTENLMTYALGRGVEAYDMPAIRAIVKRAAQDNYRLSSLLVGVVQSVPFQMRVKHVNVPAAVATRKEEHN